MKSAHLQSAVIGGILFGCALAAAAPATQPGPLQITHGPFLHAPSETGVTVVWTTSRNCVSRVEHATSPEGPWTSVSSSRHGLVEANTTLHRVRLAGLRPGTRYVYRVNSTEIVDFKPYKVVFGEGVRSDPAEFTTLDSAKRGYSVLVLNDRHEKVELLNAALKSASWEGVDLVFYNGDMLSDPGKEQQIFQGVIDPSTKLFATRIPLVFVRGNHETRGLLARDLLDYFPTDSGRYYYAMRHGPVQFLILDGGEDKADGNAEYSGLVDFVRYLEEQTQWIREQVRSDAFRSAGYRIVFVHIPPIDTKSEKFIRGTYLASRWGPLFNEGRVDLVLSGHTHQYAEVPAGREGNEFPILVGGIETVIRVDVAEQGLTLTTFDSKGQVKSTPPRIERKRR